MVEFAAFSSPPQLSPVNGQSYLFPRKMKMVCALHAFSSFPSPFPLFFLSFRQSQNQMCPTLHTHRDTLIYMAQKEYQDVEKLLCDDILNGSIVQQIPQPIVMPPNFRRSFLKWFLWVRNVEIPQRIIPPLPQSIPHATDNPTFTPTNSPTDSPTYSPTNSKMDSPTDLSPIPQRIQSTLIPQ